MSDVLLQGFSREFLRSLFDYDPASGIVRWRVKPCRRIPAGQEVRGRTAGGYYRARYEGVFIYVHRLAWFIETGEVPETIDHVNHNTSDNRWANLRAASGCDNTRHRRSPNTNSSGFKGVVHHRGNRYRAQIGITKGVAKHLGVFDTAVAAAIAYNNAAEKHFGEFAYLNDIPGVGRATIPDDSINLYI